MGPPSARATRLPVPTRCTRGGSTPGRGARRWSRTTPPIAAAAGAHVVVCSSPYESLSIVLLEAFAAGVPGLVNARSAVLKDHCLRANGGLFYGDEDEFVAALDLLVTDEALRRGLGAGGRRYVETQYRWDAVLDRYRALIEAAAG